MIRIGRNKKGLRYLKKLALIKIANEINRKRISKSVVPPKKSVLNAVGTNDGSFYLVSCELTA